MALKVLVVDDEAPARHELSYLLNSLPDVEVVAQASSGPDALKLFLVLEPRVVFLDIQMPGMDGFAVARKLHDLEVQRPFIIFTTAYDQYAVRAFEVNAVDYLLKPITEQRLTEAILRVKDRLAQDEPISRCPASVQSSPCWIQKIPVEKGGRTLLIDPADITFVVCRHKETFVNTPAGEFLTRLTLHELESRLRPPFFRIHKGFIVNLQLVAEVIPWFQGNYFLVLRDGKGSRVPVGRNKIKEVKDLLGL